VRICHSVVSPEHPTNPYRCASGSRHFHQQIGVNVPRLLRLRKLSDANAGQEPERQRADGGEPVDDKFHRSRMLWSYRAGQSPAVPIISFGLRIKRRGR
jgi:hypothetical protein